MGIGSGLAVFFMIWWTVLFVTLPLGVKRHDGSVQGADPGAPQQPNMKRKLVITTILAVIIWLIVDRLVASDISFRAMAEKIPL